MRGALAALAVAAVAGVASADPIALTGILAPRSLQATRSHAPVHLDGVLDEPAWASAPSGTQFIQSTPRPGAEAVLPTSVRVVYDDDAIYIGVRLDDPSAATIQRPIGRRDDENTSDWCFVEIDSRHDKRTAFSFGVNPSGMQVDGVFVDDTTYDVTWNAVWDAAARVDDRGWTVEYRIPFRVFAFDTPATGPMTWGLNVYRFNPHTGESSNWSPRMPQLAGVVSLFNDLVVDAHPSPHRLDVTPYALMSSADGPRAGGDLAMQLAGDMSLVASVLPDFGQVEADPAQLNLTAFELFLAEKRPLFTEGLDAFRFGTSLPLATRGDSFAEEAAFYSRRIGRSPELAAPLGTTAPSTTTIAGAAKLYGRTSDGWRAGVLVASMLGAEASDGTPVAAPEQATIARISKEANRGEDAVGVFASELHRDTDISPRLPRDESALGADARTRWDDQTYEAKAWALGTRTTKSGGAGEVRIAKVGGDLTGLVAARAISPQFDDNALGFQRNADWLVLAAQWQRQWIPNSSWLHSWRLGSDNAGIGWSWAGLLRAAVVDGYLGATFANYADATIYAQHEASVMSTEWLRGGPPLRLPPRQLTRVVAHTDTRKQTVAGVDASVAIEPGSGSRDLAITPSLSWRISDHVAGTAAASYDDQRVGWQYVGVASEASGDTYLVGRVHQRTAAVSMQVDVAITPHMIVQLYAQPFVTIGSYDHYQTVVDANRSTFSTAEPEALGIMRPDGSLRSLIASAIGRWEVRPGSFLTAVWNHNGTARGPVASLGGESGRVLHQGGSDVLLVKLAWLFAL